MGEGAAWLILGWEWAQPSPAKAPSSDPFSELSSRLGAPRGAPSPDRSLLALLAPQAGRFRPCTAGGPWHPGPYCPPAAALPSWPAALCSLFLSGPGHHF